MEAHEALSRHEHFHEHHDDDEDRRGLAQQAALLVAVIAAFLAVATFLSNEAGREAITGETKAADSSARLQANETRTTIADSDAVVLRALGAANAKNATAVATAEAIEARITAKYAPIDAALEREIEADHSDREHAEKQVLFYELAEVGLQIAIVLAGVAILARRRWLLGGSGLVAGVGIVLLGVGILV